MLTGLLALIILFARLFPETPFGRGLHFYFVEMPLRISHRIERRHLILLVILLCSGQMLAMMGSVELAMAYAVDLSIYFDAAITAALTAGAVYLKNARSVLADAMKRLATISRPRARSRRTRATSVRPDTANDDDPDWVMLQAA